MELLVPAVFYTVTPLSVLLLVQAVLLSDPTNFYSTKRSVRPSPSVQYVAAADAMSLETSSCFQVALKFGIFESKYQLLI